MSICTVILKKKHLSCMDALLKTILIYQNSFRTFFLKRAKTLTISIAILIFAGKSKGHHELQFIDN